MRVPTGFNSWLDCAIATMDARGAFHGRLFTDDDIPTQDEICAAARTGLDVLGATQVRHFLHVSD